MAETHDDLQNILNKFGDYCNTWRLKASTDKTKVIVFSRGRQSTNLTFTLNGSELEIVDEFNYLGILFNRTGNFNKTIKSVFAFNLQVLQYSPNLFKIFCRSSWVSAIRTVSSAYKSAKSFK
jgi:hypothetical protein